MKEGGRTEVGQVTTATALEDRTIALKDLIKETISQSYNSMLIQVNGMHTHSYYKEHQ